MKKYYIKIATHNSQPCWVATWRDGDPPRTLLLKNAKFFNTQQAAEAHAQKLQKRYSFDYCIVDEAQNIIAG